MINVKLKIEILIALPYDDRLGTVKLLIDLVEAFNQNQDVSAKIVSFYDQITLMKGNKFDKNVDNKKKIKLKIPLMLKLNL